MGIALVSALSCARAVALSVLADSDAAAYARERLDRLDAAAHLDPRDRALALRLVLGVTSAVGVLDDALNAQLDQPKKVAPRVRCALRVAAFEILYLDTPTEVAVSQGVELVRSVARRAAGLANAVLRRVAEGREAFLAADDADAGHREVVACARRSGLPVWLVRELRASLGPRADGLLASALEPAPLALHLNPRAESTADVVSGTADVLPGCRIGIEGASIGRDDVLARADAVVSDRHAQLIATVATRPGTCLEIGAGRGTKSFVMCSQAARAGYRRTHVALDLSERRCRANADRLARAGFVGIDTVHGDGCDLDAVFGDEDDRRRFDTVFVDAPCSGTGTMRRHAEIAWRLTTEDVRHALPALQLALLRQAASRVGDGGEVLYATCSVLSSENKAVVEAFLDSAEGSAFRLAPVSDAAIFQLAGFAGAAGCLQTNEDADGCFQSAPSSGSFDGHFCARLVRVR